VGKTKIPYCDYTWNPVTGRTHDGAGCDQCWARSLHEMRHKAHLNGNKMAPQYAHPFNFIQLHKERLTEPIKIRKPSKIAVCLGGDLFHDDVPDSFIEQVYVVMALCPQHTFQVLTKRPERRRKWYAGLDGEDGEGWRSAVVEGCAQNLFATLYPEHAKNVDEWLAVNLPLKNVWEGVSVWGQSSADEFIPLLLQTPSAIKWVSAEPILGPIEFSRIVMPDLDWWVVGGESGPHARPCDVAWIRSMVEQCKVAGVACFVKQLGAVPMESEVNWRGRAMTRLLSARNARRVPDDMVPLLYRATAGADPSEWPTDLQIREFPEVK